MIIETIHKQIGHVQMVTSRSCKQGELTIRVYPYAIEVTIEHRDTIIFNAVRHHFGIWIILENQLPEGFMSSLASDL